MSRGFKPTWEYVMLHRLTDDPPSRCYSNCTPNTCKSLEKLAGNSSAALGAKVSFVDMNGTHRKFDVIQVAEDGSGFTIRHPRVMNEGIVTLKVRRVSLKLLGAQYNEVKQTIELYSKVSGNMVLEVPLANHCHSTWGMFTHACNKKLRLPEGRAILFPPGVEEPEQIQQWTTKPQNRTQVK
jgi:hypothetical protein